MDNQTDNDVRDRIRTVFDNFEDVSADEGWLLLREKYPEKKRRAIAWLWWSAAAILALFIGVNVFNSKVKQKSEELTKIIKPHQLNVAANKKQTTNDSPALTYNNSNLLATNKPARHIEHKKVYSSTSIAKSGSNNKQSINYTRQLNTGKTLANNTTGPSSNIVANKKETDNPPPLTPSNEVKMPLDSASSAIIAANVIKQSVAPVITNNLAANNNSAKRKPVESVFKDEKYPAQKTAPVKNDGKKVQFGVYGATYVNYADRSHNTVNAGVGVTSDIAIGKNIKLSTGVLLAQNTLDYTAHGTGYAAVYIPPAAAGSAGSSTIGPGTVGPVVPANNPQTLNKASLISLDIPINLKYIINPVNNLFVSAGLSSGTFVNETYNLGSSQTVTTNKSFDNFYFGQILNVSFGVSYLFSKTNTLIIEPFLKYPLNGLGDQQIRFGAGGINLRFNFKPGK